MSEVTMPDPVAYVHRDILRRGNAVERIYPNARHGSESLGLITTDQAEAYKDACVRETLEMAAQEVELCRSHDDGQDDFQYRAAAAIRALIPKTPA